MKEKRDIETPIDKAHAIHLWEHRVDSEHKRYTDYYGADIHEPSQYDFVLDTSNLSIEEAFSAVKTFIDSKINKS